MYLHDILIFRKKTYVSMLASEYKLLIQPNFNFCWIYMQTLISHNMGMSHQIWKKKSGIHIEHKKSKICKNEEFLKQSLF